MTMMMNWFNESISIVHAATPHRTSTLAWNG